MFVNAFDLYQLHCHIVFSTKGRAPLIHSEWKGGLHAYLAGVTRHHHGIPLSINGVADHLHLLVTPSR